MQNDCSALTSVLFHLVLVGLRSSAFGFQYCNHVIRYVLGFGEYRVGFRSRG
ncbi:hypothetical protein M758_4G045600 [Ceratodon purpureus]|nr:hypothetical protein M758_4G045600 [Ceratodon purpureus]